MATTSSRTLMLLSLACIGFASLACALPVDCSKSRTMPPTQPTEPPSETSPRGTPGAAQACEETLSVPEQRGLVVDMITLLEPLRVLAEEISATIYGNNTQPKPSVGIYPGSTNLEFPENAQGLAIAHGHYFLRCFVKAVGAALINETNREVDERQPNYWNEFHTVFGNTTLLTTGIYKLVKESGARVNSCDIPRLNDPCTFGPLSPQTAAGYSTRELLLVAITNELNFFGNYLLPHLRHHLEHLS